MDAVNAPLAIRPGNPAASRHLIRVLELLHADPAEEALFEEAFDPEAGHFTLTPSPIDLPPERRRAMRQSAVDAIARRAKEVLDAMPTRLEDDRAALAGVEAAGGAEGGARRTAALRYRVEAKALLRKWARGEASGDGEG